VFKLEAARLIKMRGASVVQAARDLEVGDNLLRRWAKEG
jgi:transposase